MLNVLMKCNTYYIILIIHGKKIINKRQSVTACGYWSSFVEYIAVKKMRKM